MTGKHEADGAPRAGGIAQVPEAVVAAEVDGETAARWTFRPRPGWDEQVLRIPGRFIARNETRLTQSGRYASFYYWFYQ